MNNIFYITNDREHVLDKDRFIEALKREDDYIYDFFNSEMPYEVDRFSTCERDFEPFLLENEYFDIKVTFAEDGHITSYGESIDVTNRVKYNADKTSFTLKLGQIGTQGYLLSYATKVNDEDPIQNNSAELSADAIVPSKSSGVWLYKAAGGGVSTEVSGKLRIRKVDSETGKGLAGAKFKVTKGDKSFELTSNDEGIALSDKLELGEYKVTEITAPKGYKATSEEFSVNVTSNGGVLTIKNTKEKVEEPKKPETPKVEEPKKPETPKAEEPKETKVELPKENKQEAPKTVNGNQNVVRKTINKDVPKTGDDMNIILYGVIFSFAAGMATYLLKRRSR